MNRHMYFRQQEKNALAHHGILGQKWGVRRFQNEDGSYTAAGKERYGRGEEKKHSTHAMPIKNNKFKIVYEDNDVTEYETKLNNGSDLYIQSYKHAPDRSKDKDLEKYQNYALSELDKNVFSKIEEKEKEWRNDDTITALIKDYEKDYANSRFSKNEFDSNKPGFYYSFFNYPLAVEVNWPINDYDRITFLVNTDGSIRGYVRIT